MQYMESDINMDIIIIGEYISAGYISDPISFDNGSTPEPSYYGSNDIADVVFGDVVAVKDGDTVLFVDPISGDVVDVIIAVDAPSVPVIGDMVAVKDGGDVIYLDSISGDVVDVIVDVDAPSEPIIGGMAAVKDGGDVIYLDSISGDVVDVIVDVDAPSAPIIGDMAAVKDGGDVIYLDSISGDIVDVIIDVDAPSVPVIGDMAAVKDGSRYTITAPWYMVWHRGASRATGYTSQPLRAPPLGVSLPAPRKGVAPYIGNITPMEFF
jgi:hypothetical protein